MNVAIAGLGFMGTTHLRAWQKIPGVRIVAVVSDDPSKFEGELSAVQGNLGEAGQKIDLTGVKKHLSLEPVLTDPEVEAVDLCLPTSVHASATIAALRAGKHVLVEKPMALSGVQADEMIAAARQAGRILMTAQVLRFFPEYQVMANRIRSGELGAVRAALFRRRCAAPGWSPWMADKSQSGGGVFDLLIHDVDMCLYAFGMPQAVSATGYEDLAAGVDTITAEFYYPEFCVTVTGGWHHPRAYPFSMEYTVVTEKGTIEYSSAGRPPKLYSAEGAEQALPLAEKDGFQAELEYFHDCCAQEVHPERCPPAESAAAVKLTRLMEEARQAKGEKVLCRF